jgi:hypothetical protein
LRGKGAYSIYINKILIFLPAIFLYGCGISTTVYLYPPQDFSVSSTSSEISIKNNGSNYEPSEGSKQTFLGIDIYYRIFQNRGDADTGLSQLISSADTYDGNPDAFINYAETQGFYYMRKALISTRPTIEIAPVDARDSSLYTISVSSWKLDDSILLLRNINRLENSFSEKNFVTSDPDYEGDDSTERGTFYMVLFAVSYGVDTIGAAVYSDPVIATTILEF